MPATLWQMLSFILITHEHLLLYSDIKFSPDTEADSLFFFLYYLTLAFWQRKFQEKTHALTPVLTTFIQRETHAVTVGSFILLQVAG